MRSGVVGGLEVPGDVVLLALEGVQSYYRADKRSLKPSDSQFRLAPGQFTYDGGKRTIAMAAAGVVCLQELGRYEDWRISKNVDRRTHGRCPDGRVSRRIRRN